MSLVGHTVVVVYSACAVPLSFSVPAVAHDISLVPSVTPSIQIAFRLCFVVTSHIFLVAVPDGLLVPHEFHAIIHVSSEPVQSPDANGASVTSFTFRLPSKHFLTDRLNYITNNSKIIFKK